MKRGAAAGSTSERILATATEYLSAHHDRDVSPADAARVAGVGLRALQLAFRKGLDTTPGTWLLNLRLRRARQLLLAAEDGTSVSSAAHDSGLHHLGRFAQHYRQQFGEAPSDTLAAALELRAVKTPRVPGKISARPGPTPSQGLAKTGPSAEEKAMISIECGQLLADGTDVFAAFDTVHTVLSRRLNYRRGAIILKRSLDGRPLIYSHCRGGMDDDRFRVDMNRVNAVLVSARGIVHSVLQEGRSRLENDLDLVVDYAALDASIKSELCVPLISGGDVVGAINFESDSKNAFDLHDLALASALSFATVGQLQAERRNGSLGLSNRI